MKRVINLGCHTLQCKVVMVAVPTVLGIASIRVYTVREAPTGGLVTREKLNIYTPLPRSAQAQFIPETPGVIQNGLTTVRESVLPFVQAVQGACISVKSGSVNLYHTGQDVFFYLKDPPPDFLPRFGTITMAGLLGMFLARKGSHFKRVAVPVGLMSAGASVCYPAKAVAVLKVTGKKVYAAGQWGSATVSSLITSKSQEPVAKEIVSSQTQAAAVPNPESAVVEEASEPSSSVQSDTIPEKEVESAESVPVADEPIVAVVTEEASSITLTDTSLDQTSTETNTDAVVQSVPAETETTTTSEEIPAPVESEKPSDPKAAPTESAPVENAPSSEEPPAPKASDEPAVPIVELAEPEPAAQPESDDPPQVSAVEETPTPTLTPPPPQQPAAENNKEGSGFQPDPALMDFGQSSPEDEDLYSTRS
ncbi:hypothetical protein L3Q82_020776 [Scortum barcoo]|uniref:Uncharacterized protein n=1 Tax=Scortum barcoo TaxID=214431 RepID=A0ACB8VAP4_9TELE|nr:hypothetical protein L3Q82_020776 [Scortum barcoo]